MSKELLNCPFCGGEANCNNMGLVDHGNKPLWWVVCLQCKVSTHGDVTKEQAIAAWNRRTDEWISVDERLPEDLPESPEVLVAVRYRQDLPCEPLTICCGYLIDGEWWTYMEHNCWKVGKEPYKGDMVTHWTPLPQPPEGGTIDE